MAEDPKITLKVTTTADTKGVDKATDAVDELNKEIEKTGTTAEEVSRETDSAFDAVGTSAEETAEKIREVDSAQQDIVNSADEAGQAGKEGTAKHQDGVEKVNEALEETIEKQKRVRQSSDQETRSILSGLKTLQAGWRTVATAVSGVFGAIGLITGAIGKLKQAWEWYNREAIAAEKKRQEELENTKKRIEELEQSLKDLASQQSFEYKMYLDAQKIKEETEAITDKTAALKALLEVEEMEREADRKRRETDLEKQEIQLDEDLRKGVVTRPQADLMRLDINRERSAINRERQTGDIDAAIKSIEIESWDTSEKLKALNETIAERQEGLQSVVDVAINNDEIANASAEMARLAQVNKELEDAKKKELLWTKINGTGYRDNPAIEEKYQEKLKENNEARDAAEKRYQEALDKQSQQIEKIDPNWDTSGLTQDDIAKKLLDKTEKYEDSITREMIDVTDKYTTVLEGYDRRLEVLEKKREITLREQGYQEDTESLRKSVAEEKAADDTRAAELEQRKKELEAERAKNQETADKATQAMDTALSVIKESTDRAKESDGYTNQTAEAFRQILDTISDGQVSDSDKEVLLRFREYAQRENDRSNGQNQVAQQMLSVIDQILNVFSVAAANQQTMQATLSTQANQIKALETQIRTIQNRANNK